MNTQDRSADLTKDAGSLSSLQTEIAEISSDYRATEKELRREIFARTLWIDNPNDKTSGLLKDFRAKFRGDAIVNGLASRLETLVARHQALTKTIADMRAALDAKGAEICGEIRERTVADYRAEISNAAKILLPLYDNKESLASEAALHTPRCKSAFGRVPCEYAHFGGDALSRARAFANFIKRSATSAN